MQNLSRYQVLRVIFFFSLLMSDFKAISSWELGSYNNITVVVSFSQESEFPFSTVTDSNYNSLVWEHNRTDKMLFSEHTGIWHLFLLLGNPKRMKRSVACVRKVLLKLKCLHTDFELHKKKNHLFCHFFINTNLWNRMISYEFLFNIEWSDGKRLPDCLSM